MNKKANKVDLSEILRPYGNMWVALSKDNEKVIESGKTLNQLLKKLKGKDHKEFEFMKVPEFGVCYAPSF
ncbi:MAG: DUF5678 domain-containing protein [Candidatus Aminicenantaceae bacterium]